MDTEEVAEAITKLLDENQILKIQTKLLLSDLQWLCDQYLKVMQTQKLLRYVLLKGMIKAMIYGDSAQEILYVKCIRFNFISNFVRFESTNGNKLYLLSQLKWTRLVLNFQFIERSCQTRTILSQIYVQKLISLKSDSVQATPFLAIKEPR